MGRYHDVTVLYGTNDHKLPFQQEVEAYLAEHGPIHGVTFHAVPHPPLSLWCQKLHDAGFWATYYIGYAAWQREALKVARKLHSAHPFDLVHHLNMIGYREPGYLWRLPVPFVWGPVGGAANMPWAYFGQMSLRGQLFYGARNIVNDLQKRWMGRCRSAAETARHIWVVDVAARQLVEQVWHRSSSFALEVGTTGRAQASIKKRLAGQSLHLCWSGEHIDRKYLPILLHALKRIAPERRPSVTILGDGPETERWKNLAEQLGISALLQWTGKIPYRQALDTMAGCDLFVSTSLMEATSNVVLEALSFGMPVICHDTCGMSVAVTAECGIKIEMHSFQRSVERYAGAVLRVDGSPSLLEEMSRGAIRRHEQLGWDQKVESFARTYDEIAEKFGPRAPLKEKV
jgi:glycosyltransferase involved in cell wall biosynthesis